jgi:hypothetical protein
MSPSWVEIEPLVNRRDILGEQKMNRRCLMKESTQAEQLVMRWLPVADVNGRTRMEAVWICVPVGANVAAHSVTHAA